MGPIASDAESEKFYFWRNKNFRRGIRRGLGGLNLFRDNPRRSWADPRRIGETSAAEKTEKRPPASATRRVRECPPRTFSKVRVGGRIPLGRGLNPTYQQRWQARPSWFIGFLGQAPCYKSAEGRCRRQRPEVVIIPFRGVNGVVVWPWAQNRKIKSSSIAAALLIPHTC